MEQAAIEFMTYTNAWTNLAKCTFYPCYLDEIFRNLMLKVQNLI